MSQVPLVKDDEIVVDKDGIPHFNGVRPELMREYKRRVIFAFSMLDGEGDTEEKERKDLDRKKRRFAKRLLDALHGEAWQCCQPLLSELEQLTQPEGYKKVLEKLGQIERVTVIRKTEQFDKFFERGYRRKGQALDVYLRQRRQDWHDLKELDEGTSMSDDLLAYFILKQCNLSREDRRQILLNSQSKYDLTEIEKAMRISFYDIHEKEKSSKSSWDNRPTGKGYGKQRKNYANFTEDAAEYEYEHDDEPVYEDDEAHGYEVIPEDEDQAYETYEQEPAAEVSDAGASGDDEIYAAYSNMDKQRRSYKDSRQRLKDLQKSRGFFKGELTFEERKAAVAKEKERTRCSACGRIGHWAGDAQCSKTSKSGPKKDKGKGRGKGKKSGKAYMVSEVPMYFTLDDTEEMPCSAYMLRDDNDENEMQQDEGLTELDLRRKVPNASSGSETGWKPPNLSSGSETGWSYISADEPVVPMPGHEMSSSHLELPRRSTAAAASETRQMPLTMEEEANVDIIHVRSLSGVRPDIESFTLRELQHECDVWGIKVSGNKDEVLQRLNHFFMGQPVKKKGCSRQCVMLEEKRDGVTSSKPVAKPKPKVKAAGSASRAADLVGGGTCPSDRCYPSPSSEASPGIAPKPKTSKSKTSGYGYMASDSEANGSPGSSDHQAFEFMKSPSPEEDDDFRDRCRKFRSSEDFQAPPDKTKQTKDSKIEPAKAPSPVPKYDDDFPLKHGQVLPGYPCKVCAGDMVVRQNSRTGKFFFGCARFGQTGCKFTLEYKDGLDLVKRGQRAQWSRAARRCMEQALCLYDWFRKSSWPGEFNSEWAQWWHEFSQWDFNGGSNRCADWLWGTQHFTSPTWWRDGRFGWVPFVLAWHSMHILHAQPRVET